jgi:hypothetical protein
VGGLSEEEILRGKQGCRKKMTESGLEKGDKCKKSNRREVQLTERSWKNWDG